MSMALSPLLLEEDLVILLFTYSSSCIGANMAKVLA